MNVVSQADAIRSYAYEQYVRPWRQSGAARQLAIRAGDTLREMGLRNAAPNVCSALSSQAFLSHAGLVLVKRTGPHASTTTTFYYESGGAGTSLPKQHKTERLAQDDPLPAADLCLVSCVKTKLDRPAPARELYRSDWFRKARAVVERHGWPWGILSTRYGLVHSDETITPYEKTLNDMRASERRAWAARVIEALDPLLDDGNHVVFFAGMAYREHLEPHLRGRAITVHVPMAGLKQGEQLSWLARHACR